MRALTDTNSGSVIPPRSVSSRSVKKHPKNAIRVFRDPDKNHPTNAKEYIVLLSKSPQCREGACPFRFNYRIR